MHWHGFIKSYAQLGPSPANVFISQDADSRCIIFRLCIEGHSGKGAQGMGSKAWCCRQRHAFACSAETVYRISPMLMGTSLAAAHHSIAIVGFRKSIDFAYMCIAHICWDSTFGKQQITVAGETLSPWIHTPPTKRNGKRRCYAVQLALPLLSHVKCTAFTIFQRCSAPKTVER